MEKGSKGAVRKPVHKWSKKEKVVGSILISVLVNFALWLIPWMDYTPGVTGRGFPLVWYTKWRSSGASPQIHFAYFVVDFLIILAVVSLIITEISVIEAIKERKGRR